MGRPRRPLQQRFCEFCHVANPNAHSDTAGMSRKSGSGFYNFATSDICPTGMSGRGCLTASRKNRQESSTQEKTRLYVGAENHGGCLHQRDAAPIGCCHENRRLYQPSVFTRELAEENRTAVFPMADGYDTILFCDFAGGYFAHAARQGLYIEQVHELGAEMRRMSRHLHSVFEADIVRSVVNNAVSIGIVPVYAAAARRCRTACKASP